MQRETDEELERERERVRVGERELLCYDPLRIQEGKQRGFPITAAGGGSPSHVRFLPHRLQTRLEAKDQLEHRADSAPQAAFHSKRVIACRRKGNTTKYKRARFVQFHHQHRIQGNERELERRRERKRLWVVRGLESNPFFTAAGN